MASDSRPIRFTSKHNSIRVLGLMDFYFKIGPVMNQVFGNKLSYLLGKPDYDGEYLLQVTCTTPEIFLCGQYFVKHPLIDDRICLKEGYVYSLTFEVTSAPCDNISKSRRARKSKAPIGIDPRPADNKIELFHLYVPAKYIWIEYPRDVLSNRVVVDFKLQPIEMANVAVVPNDFHDDLAFSLLNRMAIRQKRRWIFISSAEDLLQYIRSLSDDRIRSKRKCRRKPTSNKSGSQRL